ncbi:hypothetical protein U1839_06875 [Sphingomonas sp. RT2P30]|uniref:MotE family protein n=1 Tax=Parasphingomonas halimpatiens TaxID=3096162 RepID=UPI002FCA328C
MIRRPSLLMLTAAAATISTLAHAVSATSPSPEAPATRLGTAIKQDLAAHDESAARRNRALELREQVARAAEERIKADLRARQQQADAATDSGTNAAKEAQYDNLARIYQAMKPTKAALVFEQLDMDVQMKVAQRMRERSTAMILAAMTPGGAADLSMSLARKSPKRKELPLSLSPRPGRRPAP